MNQQISRLAPHQNGKVAGLLIALSSMVFLAPVIAMLALMPVQHDQNGHPVAIPWISFLLLPLFYLVVGYLFTLVSCFFYNLLTPVTGGFEFDVERPAATMDSA